MIKHYKKLFSTIKRGGQTNKDFLRRELKENPEFFKAFPHLQEPVYYSTIRDAENKTSSEYIDTRTHEFID